MQNILCTFSGGFGDILWSLPTVREISKANECQVDMMVMPHCQSLLPLLQAQSYIRKAMFDENWFCTGSPHGDQPWEPPYPWRCFYDNCYHLTYRRHPGPHEPLVNFILSQQGAKSFSQPVVPFIETEDEVYNADFMRTDFRDAVAYSFNDMYDAQKNHLVHLLTAGARNVRFVNVRPLSWRVAAFVIRHSIAFIGCRSSNYVLAHGVGQKNILVYEPHPNRNANGYFGQTFGNPHWPEQTLHLDLEVAATEIAIKLDRILEEKHNEIHTA